MVEPLLTKSKTAGEAALKAMQIGAPIAAAQQPVSPEGEITPLQPIERAKNIAMSIPFSAGFGAVGQRIGKMREVSTRAKDLKTDPVSLADEYVSMVDDAEDELSRLAQEAKKRSVLASVGGEGEVSLSRLKEHDYTGYKNKGRPVIPELMADLEKRITYKPSAGERVADDIKYGGENVQMPLQQQQNVSALPVPEIDLNQFPLRNFSVDQRGTFPPTLGGQEDLFNVLNQAKVIPNNVRMSSVIPANTPKSPLTTEQMRKLILQGRLDELSRSRGDLVAQMGSPKTIEQPVQIQQSLGIKAVPNSAKKIANDNVKVSGEELHKIKEAFDDVAYAMGENPGLSTQKLHAKDIADNARQQLYKIGPEVESNLKQAEDLLKFKSDDLSRINKNTILSKMRAKEGSDIDVLLQQIDQKIGGTKFSDQNKLLNEAVNYNRPWSANPFSSVWRLGTEQIPGGLGRLANYGSSKIGVSPELTGEIGRLSLPVILNALSQERAVKRK
jgi:hypothetical protein